MSDPYDVIDNHSNEDDLDSKLDGDFDETQQLVEDRYVGNNMEVVKQINDFFGNDRFVVEKTDKRVNLFEQGGKFRRIVLKPEDTQLAFALIDRARQEGIRLHWTEKQCSGQSAEQMEPACIMLDLDVYQTGEQLQINEASMQRFTYDVCKVLNERFQSQSLPEQEQLIFVAVFKRPRITYYEDKQAWKDGYHIGIYVRLTRDEKRYLVNEILTQKLLTKAFGKLVQTAECMPNIEQALDTACVHVPPLLYGSTKADSATGPYRLWLVFQMRIEDSDTVFPTRDDKFSTRDGVLNHTLELSYNFQGRLIQKNRWQVKPEFAEQVSMMGAKIARNTSVQEREELLDEMQQLLLSDPDAEYMKNVLECLKPERYNNRKLWFNVVYALVKNAERYIPLAKWFSKKSNKYDEMGFMRALEDVAKADYPLNHESIYYWASQDAPEAYKACNDKSCFLMMSNFVFDGIQEGKLNHAHYAELIHMMLKNKYKTDYKDRKGKDRVWYEFIFPGDPHEKGQVYKWAEVLTPDSLDIFLHRKLNDLCAKMLRFLNKKIKSAQDQYFAKIAVDKNSAAKEKAMMQYYVNITKNFRASARGLWADGFKSGILRQSEKIFQSRGFARSLDQGEYDLGVGNGILVLDKDGKLPKMIKSYNTCRVSRFTPTNYQQFDPKDPTTRKILRALRSMHPDTETDAYEYKMSFKAASIDNRSRETIILLITGPGSNGKSFEFGFHAATMGEQYCVQLPIQLLIAGKEENGEAASPFMSKLEAARASYYEEGPSCAVLDMPKVKRITGCAKLPTRNLYEEGKNIVSRCYHFVLSNHDFTIMTHEEAVWRRLRYLWMSITFKDELDFDPNNPLHRLKDHSFNDKFSNEEESKTAYLGIMTFYHMKLMRYHGGIIDHVPHPTIDRHTEDFRNRQDTLNKFISERIVISPNQPDPIDLDKIVEQYYIWYAANIGNLPNREKKNVVKQLIDSSLAPIIDISGGHGGFLKPGYRVIAGATDISAEETPFTKDSVKSHIRAGGKKYRFEYAPETPDEYLLRVDREWADLTAYLQDEKSVDYLERAYAEDEYLENCEDGDITKPNFDPENGEAPEEDFYAGLSQNHEVCDSDLLANMLEYVA